jgi:hypothetical protein
MSRYKSNQRARQLSSRERVGRFARNQVWERVTNFMRGSWAILLGALVLPSLVTLPIVFFIHGSDRWIIVGAAGISGPWTVALITILLSGIADPIMGLDAEGSTADVLRRLKRRGWKLANGIKVKGKEDIDHLVVGPIGVLVVESKWSRHRWPIDGGNPPFMSEQLDNTVEQVLRNSKYAKIQFADVLGDIPVQSVCVLWSAEDSSMDPPWIERQGAVVVRGPELGNWLRSLKSEGVDDVVLNRIWNKIDRQATIRDNDDLKKTGPPRPTVGRIFTENILFPFLGAAVTVYGLAGISLIRQGWLDLASAFGLLMFGLLTLWFSASKAVLRRRFATGTIALSGIYCLLYLVVIIRALSH